MRDRWALHVGSLLRGPDQGNRKRRRVGVGEDMRCRGAVIGGLGGAFGRPGGGVLTHGSFAFWWV